MRRYGSRRNDNNHDGAERMVHGTKSSRVRAHREGAIDQEDLELRWLPDELAALPEFCELPCCVDGEAAKRRRWEP